MRQFPPPKGTVFTAGVTRALLVILVCFPGLIYGQGPPPRIPTLSLSEEFNGASPNPSILDFPIAIRTSPLGSGSSPERAFILSGNGVSAIELSSSPVSPSGSALLPTVFDSTDPINGDSGNGNILPIPPLSLRSADRNIPDFTWSNGWSSLTAETTALTLSTSHVLIGTSTGAIVTFQLDDEGDESSNLSTLGTYQQYSSGSSITSMTSLPVDSPMLVFSMVTPALLAGDAVPGLSPLSSPPRLELAPLAGLDSSTLGGPIVALSQNDTALIASVGGYLVPLSVDLATGALTQSGAAVEACLNGEAIHSLAVDPAVSDDPTVLALCGQGRVAAYGYDELAGTLSTLWNITTGANHTRASEAIAVAPSGQVFIVAHGDAAGTASSWSMVDGSPIDSWTGLSYSPSTVAFSPVLADDSLWIAGEATLTTFANVSGVDPWAVVDVTGDRPEGPGVAGGVAGVIDSASYQEGDLFLVSGVDRALSKWTVPESGLVEFAGAVYARSPGGLDFVPVLDDPSGMVALSDGVVVVVGGASCSLTVFAAENLTQLYTLEAAHDGCLNLASADIADGPDRLVTIGSAEVRVWSWDGSSINLETTDAVPIPALEQSFVTEAGYSLVTMGDMWFAGIVGGSAVVSGPVYDDPDQETVPVVLRTQLDLSDPIRGLGAGAASDNSVLCVVSVESISYLDIVRNVFEPIDPTAVASEAVALPGASSSDLAAVVSCNEELCWAGSRNDDTVNRAGSVLSAWGWSPEHVTTNSPAMGNDLTQTSAEGLSLPTGVRGASNVVLVESSGVLVNIVVVPGVGPSLGAVLGALAAMIFAVLVSITAVSYVLTRVVFRRTQKRNQKEALSLPGTMTTLRSNASGSAAKKKKKRVGSASLSMNESAALTAAMRRAESPGRKSRSLGNSMTNSAGSSGPLSPNELAVLRETVAKQREAGKAATPAPPSAPKSAMKSQGSTKNLGGVKVDTSKNDVRVFTPPPVKIYSLADGDEVQPVAPAVVVAGEEDYLGAGAAPATPAGMVNALRYNSVDYDRAYQESLESPFNSINPNVYDSMYAVPSPTTIRKMVATAHGQPDPAPLVAQASTDTVGILPPSHVPGQTGGLPANANDRYFDSSSETGRGRAPSVPTWAPPPPPGAQGGSGEFSSDSWETDSSDDDVVFDLSAAGLKTSDTASVDGASAKATGVNTSVDITETETLSTTMKSTNTNLTNLSVVSLVSDPSSASMLSGDSGNAAPVLAPGGLHKTNSTLSGLTNASQYSSLSIEAGVNEDVGTFQRMRLDGNTTSSTQLVPKGMPALDEDTSVSTAQGGSGKKAARAGMTEVLTRGKSAISLKAPSEDNSSPAGTPPAAPGGLIAVPATTATVKTSNRRRRASSRQNATSVGSGSPPPVGGSKVVRPPAPTGTHSQSSFIVKSKSGEVKEVKMDPVTGKKKRRRRKTNKKGGEAGPSGPPGSPVDVRATTSAVKPAEPAKKGVESKPSKKADESRSKNKTPAPAPAPTPASLKPPAAAAPKGSTSRGVSPSRIPLTDLGLDHRPLPAIPKKK